MRQKTETRQVYNEELGCYEWKEVETDKYVFDETDKAHTTDFGCRSV